MVWEGPQIRVGSCPTIPPLLQTSSGPLDGQQLPKGHEVHGPGHQGCIWSGRPHRVPWWVIQLCSQSEKALKEAVLEGQDRTLEYFHDVELEGECCEFKDSPRVQNQA